MSTQQEILAANESEFSKYRYTLWNEISGTYILEVAPDGWNDEFTTERHPVFHGLFRTYSNQTLHFVKKARTYLYEIKESQGINAEVTFTIERIDEDWAFETVFTGVVLVHSLKFTDITAEAQIEDIGGLSKFHNRKGVELDVYGRKTLDGLDVAELTEQVTLPEQEFTLLAKWEATDFFNTSDLDITDGIIPLDIVVNEYPTQATSQDDTAAVNSLDAAFFQNTSLTAAYTGTLSGTIRHDPLLIGANFSVRVRMYDSSSGLQISETPITLTDISTGIWGLDQSITVPINAHAVLLFSYSATTPYTAVTGQPATGVTWRRDNISTQITLRGVGETYPQKTITGVNVYTAFERLTYMISHLSFDSTYLDKATGILISLTEGKNIRGKDGKVTLSIDNLFKSVFAVYPIGLSYENSKIIVENLSYFYSNTVGLDLSDRVSAGDIETEYLTDFFNQVTFGFSKADSEFKNGLGEYNAKVEYSSAVKFDKKKSILSTYRGDTIGIAKLRSKAILSDTEDVNGDEDIFMIRTVVDGGSWKAKTTEGYDIAPTGWYNLDFAPGRAIRRHQLAEYIPVNSDLRLEKREKDTNLISQETGQTAIDELANVPATDLPTRLWKPEKITVRVNLTKTEVDAINAKQKIKLTDDLSGWIMKLTKNYKNNEVTLEMLRSWS